MIAFRLSSRAATAAAPISLAPARSDALKLSVGNGAPATLPDLTEETHLALTQYRQETLQYGPLYGLDALRDGLAHFLAGDGVAATRENIIVVNGGKQALELIGRALIDPGDAVIVTAPTFITTLTLFAGEGATFISIGQDDEGMLVDDLEAILKERRGAGLPPPKFAFDMPDFHNPTGVTMSLARRRRLLELASEHDFLIVEDDPYRRIRFSGDPLPTIKSMDAEGRVIGVGTMAKILSPGLKVGWVNAAPAFIARLAALKADGGSQPLAQRVVALLIESGRLDRIIASITDEMRRRRDAIAEAFQRHMPDARFRLPGGGYFLWVEMPDGTDCDALAELAGAHGVSVFSGSHCFAAEPRRNFLRISYSFCAPAELDIAVRRLAGAWAAHRRRD